MTEGNQGKVKLWSRLTFLFTGRYAVAKHTAEGLATQALKKQLRVYEELFDKQSSMISDMTQQLRVQNEGSSQDKIIDAFSQYFLPQKTQTPNQTPNTNVGSTPIVPNGFQQSPALVSESGVVVPQDNIDYSDEELKQMIGNYDQKALKGGLALGEDFLFKKILENFPQASEKSARRAIEITKEIFQ